MNELAAALTAATIVGLGAIYWQLKFRLLLPTEARLHRERLDWSERGTFSQELLEAHPLPETPEALSESIQFGVDRFLARFGGVDLFVWIRRDEIGSFEKTDGELAVRTGILESLEMADLNLEDDLWVQASEKEGGAFWSEDLPGDVGRLLSTRGGRSLRLIPWGTRGRLWGLIGAVGGQESAAAERHAEPLATLAAYFSSMADRAARFWDLEGAREQLQGGLDVTMQRLDETNLQLIQRAKEMNTVKEVTDIISDHPDQPDVLSAIVALVAKSLEADICEFLLLDDETGELVTQPGAHGVDDGPEGRYRISLSTKEASSVRVFSTGEPFVTGDAQNDPQVISHYAKLWNVSSLMIVPLRIESRRIGVMRVGSFKQDLFKPEHVSFVQVIAEEAAVLIESAVLSKKLHESNVELKHLHSMKDDFVSTVSHEFKTPLTSIQGFLAVLLEGETGDLTDEQVRFLKIVKNAADRLHLLVADLLDLSKLEGGLKIALHRLDLVEAARNCVDSQRLAAEERGVILSLEAGEDLPPVRGSEQWIGQVFDNLVSNAIKFTAEGGSVSVGIENKGEGLLVRVADTGIGIPKKEQERVFEKFFRASNRADNDGPAPGTGLGLAICRQIIDRHGGRIWFESEAGKGTRFFFMVPTERRNTPVAVKNT
ncbi:MAG: hypothetical protein COB53_09330 [Elusimicrobia bacterium]|nr:MAG: hypothetical protein COB53_09330 [Elusimicrobiota bacterium]